MCIVCGDMSHEGLELIKKAFKKTYKVKTKEQPRFKALAMLERDFKKEYIETIGDMEKEIFEEINKMQK